jgi:hypothetical protein
MVAGTYELNKLGTDAAPVAITKDTAYNYLVRLGVVLDERDVPADGRYAIIPPAYHGLLLQDDRFVKTGGTAAEIALGKGYIGMAAGFTLYKSNNLPHTLGVYKVIASYKGSTSYAEQVIKNEAYRIEKRFADGMKGLHVYGGKVLRGKKIAVLTATFDSGFLDVIELTSTEGTASGKTAVAVSPAVPSGYTAKYKTGASVAAPQYDDVLTTGWTAFTAGADITATTGHDIVVAYIDASNKAKGAGKTVVVSKA